MKRGWGLEEILWESRAEVLAGLVKCEEGREEDGTKTLVC